MAPPPLLHVLLALLLLVSVFFAASTAVPDCTPYRCGDGGNITYPFWHVDGVKSLKSYCGYMFMGLTCKDGSPTLLIDFINYKVKNVNTSNRMFLLVDADVEDTKCPWDRKNLTLDVGFTRLFHYAPSASNLTFLFNCTRHLPNIPHIPCFRDVRNFKSYVLRDWVAADKGYMKHLSGSCQKVVELPVDRRRVELIGQNISKEYGSALQQGFQLQCKKPDLKLCNECEGSGGFCGFSNGANVCYCAGGVVHEAGSCHHGKALRIDLSCLARF